MQRRWYRLIALRFKSLLTARFLYLFFIKIRPYAGRYLFLIFCILGFMWYALYTRDVIAKLRLDATNVTQTYAEP
ncbi:MAG: hypothetical protein PHC61_18405, partial [Chitinivibrionales bacterium]|nr:hypothetical protein [Chitinivibrionales bacterium]